MFYLSLTSIYQNQDRLFATLYYILKNQTILPDKILVYLSEEPFLLDQGFPKRQITDVNLNKLVEEYSSTIEIKWVKNIGPYRKLFYTLNDLWESKTPIIVIDDDWLYNKFLFEKLLADFEKENCSINYRGFTSNITDIKTMNQFSYQLDRKIKNTKSVYNFSTGCSGTVYSSSFFENVKHLFFREDIFLKECSTGDDIWFNLMRMLSGTELFLRKDDSWSEKSLLNYQNSLFERYNKFNDNNTFLWRNTFNRIRFIMES